ncbi:ribonuclease P protein component [Canibacter sp. lx-72]|uniref:ribonuclease P protein component n=1 Tax=Canibacter zhuwentaonis TaxID=2837491 RepID=UPI001BDC2A6D|nr:ribonuclease P protein component [Canibacter zhuwentaonis]MBT1018119.1 ribonuclease P protein component [Canibacter zhuwentaonis]MBT1035346.1 ribonuclease P protein component [Canibacter zhuwentaonis]
MRAINRVKRGADYRYIVKYGKCVYSKHCIVYAIKSEVLDSSCADSKFGFIITRAVGNAIVRNLMRRRFKAIARGIINSGLTGVCVVVRVLPAATATDYQELEVTVLQQLKRIREKLENA